MPYLFIPAVLLIVSSTVTCLPMPQSTTDGGACAPGWVSTAVYTHGNTVSVGGQNYVAGWWTQGEDPSSASGPVGSGMPWTLQASCSSAAGNSASAAVNATSTAASHTFVGIPFSTEVPISSSTKVPTSSTTEIPTSSSTEVPTSSSTIVTTASSTEVPTSSSTAVSSNTQHGGIATAFYKDVTMALDGSKFGTMVTGSSESLLQAWNAPVIFAFANGECGSETWGSSLTPADVASNIQDFVAANIPYGISTGGYGAQFTCASLAGFQTFLDAYNSSMLAVVDFDIESSQTTAEIESLVSLAAQAQKMPQYAHIQWMFTIGSNSGAATQGLNQFGIDVTSALLKYPVADSIINLMAMDYGSVSPSTCVVSATDTSQCDMGLSAIQAAELLHSQHGIEYSRIALTVMIGDNDSVEESFTLDDVATVAAYVKLKGLAGMHAWALDRDTPCSGDVGAAAQATCNKVATSPLAFVQAFAAAGF